MTLPARFFDTLLAIAIPAAVVACLMSLAGLTGCTPYSKEVSRTGVISKLHAQQQGTYTPPPTEIHPVFMVPGGKIRVEDEEGNITLYAKSFKHLINHIIYTLENDERDLFTEQVLSKITIDEYKERGLDPGLAYDELLKSKRDVYSTFHHFPMGESTPGIHQQTVGTNMFRLAFPRHYQPDIRWTGMDASFEDGNYKLRWFVN